MRSTSMAALLVSMVFISAGGGALCAPAQQSDSPAASSAPQETAPDSQAAPSLTGSWQVTWTARNGTGRQATLDLKQEGDKLSGSFQGERGSVPIKGSVKGTEITFDVKMPRRKISFSGTVDGDKMSGTTEQGASWTAARQ